MTHSVIIGTIVYDFQNLQYSTKLNTLGTFSFDLFDVTTTIERIQPVTIKYNNIIIFNGVIDKVDVDEFYDVWKVSGFCEAFKLDTLITGQWKSFWADDIIREIVPTNVVERASVISYEARDIPQYRVISEIAQQVGFDWSVNGGKVNFVKHKGSITPVEVFNNEIGHMDVKPTEIYNSIVVYGAGDGVTQLISRTTHDTLNRAILTEHLIVGLTSATVDSTTGFPETGKLKIGIEEFTYASKTATKFVGLVRGIDIEPYNHTIGKEIYEVVPAGIPQPGSSIALHGLREKPPIVRRSIYDQDSLDQVAQWELKKSFEIIETVNLKLMVDNVAFNVGDKVTVGTTDYRVISISYNNFIIDLELGSDTELLGDFIGSSSNRIQTSDTFRRELEHEAIAGFERWDISFAQLMYRTICSFIDIKMLPEGDKFFASLNNPTRLIHCSLFEDWNIRNYQLLQTMTMSHDNVKFFIDTSGLHLITLKNNVSWGCTLLEQYSLVNSFSLPVDDSAPTNTKMLPHAKIDDIFLLPNALYILEGGRIIQYRLLVGWDISNMVFVTSFNIPREPITSFAITGNILVASTRDGYMYQFQLQTPWDISYASLRTFNKTPMSIVGMYIQAGHMYVIGEEDKIYLEKYRLNPPFYNDVLVKPTEVLNSCIVDHSTHGEVRSMTFNHDETLFYIVYRNVIVTYILQSPKNTAGIVIAATDIIDELTDMNSILVLDGRLFIHNSNSLTSYEIPEGILGISNRVFISTDLLGTGACGFTINDLGNRLIVIWEDFFEMYELVTKFSIIGRVFLDVRQFECSITYGLITKDNNNVFTSTTSHLVAGLNISPPFGISNDGLRIYHFDSFGNLIETALDRGFAPEVNVSAINLILNYNVTSTLVPAINLILNYRFAPNVKIPAINSILNYGVDTPIKVNVPAINLTLNYNVDTPPLPPFGSVIRSTTSPGTRPSGIGGDSSTIWHCDRVTDKVYELSIVDFSVIRSTGSPYTRPHGIGGDNSVIWHGDSRAFRIYELSTVDFSVIRLIASIGTGPNGIGGDNSTIWHCDSHAVKIYELSTIDFSVIRSTASPYTRPYGIGGDNSTIWLCDIRAFRIYELSTIDFSVIHSTTSPHTSPSGIGGDSSTIWHGDNTADKVYELSTG